MPLNKTVADGGSKVKSGRRKKNNFKHCSAEAETNLAFRRHGCGSNRQRPYLTGPFKRPPIFVERNSLCCSNRSGKTVVRTNTEGRGRSKRKNKSTMGRAACRAGVLLLLNAAALFYPEMPTHTHRKRDGETRVNVRVSRMLLFPAQS